MIGSSVAVRRQSAGRGKLTRPGRWRLAVSSISVAITYLCMLLTSGAALAAPARPDPLLLRQPDGTTLVAQRGGDERLNWISVDGRLVEQGPDGFWRYVLIDQGVRQLIDARAGLDPAPADAASVADAIALHQTATQPIRAFSGIHRAWGTAVIAPPRATEPLLVLLVEFVDRKLQTQEADWAKAFFGESGKTVRTYYQEASRYRFWFAPAAETCGITGDGVVRVRLSRPHPNPGNKIGEANKQIVRDALIAADAYVDFAAFDTDRDGSLSSAELHIATVVAGYDGGEAAPSVWGHKGWLFDAVAGPTLDGVVVGDWYRDGGYVQVGELCDGGATPIGPICHELGHDLGLPDLYDIDGSSYGTGTHCLMSNGAWGAVPGEPSGTTPVLLSAWCRIKLGFVTPTVVSGAGNYTVVQACNTADCNVLQILTSNSDEYFLVENRQLSGFDAGLSRAFRAAGGDAEGGGIAIWHVDESVDNNNYEARKFVDLEEANELEVNGSQLDRKDNWGCRRHYYHAGHATDFNDNTVPNSRLNDGATTGITIGGISASGETMTLTVGAPANVVISGCVRSTDGTGLAGVVLHGLPNNPVTDENGYYRASAPPGWSGTVRPSVQGRAFNPASRTYRDVTSSRTQEDYIADGDIGVACPAAGFSPIVLWTCLLAWLARMPTKRPRSDGR